MRSVCPRCEGEGKVLVSGVHWTHRGMRTMLESPDEWLEWCELCERTGWVEEEEEAA